MTRAYTEFFLGGGVINYEIFILHAYKHFQSVWNDYYTQNPNTHVWFRLEFSFYITGVYTEFFSGGGDD